MEYGLKSVCGRNDFEAAQRLQHSPESGSRTLLSADSSSTSAGLGKLDCVDVFEVLRHGMLDVGFLKNFSQVSRSAAKMTCAFAAHVQQTGVEQRRRVACSALVFAPAAAQGSIRAYAPPELLAADRFLIDAEIRGLYRAVRQLCQQGRWNDAEKLFDRSAAAPETAAHSPPWFELGKIVELWGDFKRAAGYFAQRDESGLSLEQNLRSFSRASTLFLAGLDSVTTGRVDLARHAFEQALRHRPDGVGVLLELARLAKKQGDLIEATRHIEAALAVRDDLHMAFLALGEIQYCQRRPQEALASLRRAAERLDHSHKLHYATGKVHRSLGNLEAAKASFERCITINGTSVHARIALAKTLYKQQDYQACVEQFKATLQNLSRESSTRLTALYGLSRALLCMDQSDAALGYVSEALGLRPTEAEGHVILGHIHKGRRHWNVAVAHYKQALVLAEDTCEAHVALGQLGRKVFWRADVDAVAHFKRALELEPCLYEARLGLSEELRHRGLWAEAEASYQRALLLRPDGGDIFLGLGAVQLRMKRYAQAEVSYRAALAAAPLRAEAHFGLGQALLRQSQDLDAAYVSLARALELDDACTVDHSPLFTLLQQELAGVHKQGPHDRLAEGARDPNLWLRLSRAFTGVNKTRLAVACCRRALDIEPNHAAAHKLLGDLFRLAQRWRDAAVAYRTAGADVVTQQDWAQLADEAQRYGVALAGVELRQAQALLLHMSVAGEETRS